MTCNVRTKLPRGTGAKKELRNLRIVNEYVDTRPHLLVCTKKKWCIAPREVSKQQEEVQDFKEVAVQHNEKVFSNKMLKLRLKLGLSPRLADADVQVKQAALGGACNLPCDNYMFRSRLSDVEMAHMRTLRTNCGNGVPVRARG